MNPPVDQTRAIYDQIVHIYDLAERILDSTGAPMPRGESAPEALKLERLDLALPVIEQAQASADTVSKIYVEILEQQRKATAAEVKTVEKAIRSIFNTIIQYTTKLEQLPAS